MKKILIAISLLLSIESCKSTKAGFKKPTLLDETRFRITEISTDETYGFTEKNAVKVNCTTAEEKVKNERRFLNALAGNNGEAIKYQRLNSCCHFKTESKDAIMGIGLLDVYEVKIENDNTSKRIYINMYECDNLKAPVGFSIRK